VFFLAGIEASDLEAVYLYCKGFATACLELDSGKSSTRKNAPLVNLSFLNNSNVLIQLAYLLEINYMANKFMNL